MDSKIFYMIGNAHIDPVWLWRKPEGMAEIRATFRSALDRMKEFDGYIFTAACASYYKQIEETEPEMFEEIKARVKEGRWALVGGMWVQPDCNIPSGESFARHLLLSQKYFKEKFGVYVDTGYNVDSFGHNGMLPQIFSQAKIRNYIFMRPDSRGEKGSLPENLFWWESPDGSRVLTYRIPNNTYCSELLPNMDEYKNFVNRDGFPYMVFYGVGNHGGGPTVRTLKMLEPMLEANAKYASPTEYFDDMRKSGVTDGLRVLKEDLQHHASGCYAANSTVKKLNREAECNIIRAEKTLSLCRHLLPDTKDYAYNDKLTSAWERLLFNQFHDILAGCAIKKAYIEANNAFGYVSETAEDIFERTLGRIAWHINTKRYLTDAVPEKSGLTLWEKEGEGAPIVVFNPCSYPVHRAVKVNNSSITAVCDRDGKEIRFQQVRGGQTNGMDRTNAMFFADIPAYGYRVYYVYRQKASEIQQTGNVFATETTLENGRIKATFDKRTGGISSLIDKATGKEYAASPLAVANLYDETEYDTWSHGVFTFDNYKDSFSDAEFEVVENGPIRAAIKVTTSFNNSKLTQYFTLCEDADAIEVSAKLFFAEEHRILRLEFPANLNNPKALYSMPYGTIEKPADGCEEPTQRFAAVVGEGGSALAVLSDCKYSFRVKSNQVGMTVARSCFYADHYGVRDNNMSFQDMGELLFRYAIAPQNEFKPSELFMLDELISHPLAVIHETHHDGELEPIYAGIEGLPTHVICSAVKPSYDNCASVFRIFETDGLADSLDFTILGHRIMTQIKPYEIMTFRIDNDGKVSQTDILE